MSETTEKDLWLASLRYLRGEISSQELQALEVQYAERFLHALMALAKCDIARKFWRKWRWGRS